MADGNTVRIEDYGRWWLSGLVIDFVAAFEVVLDFVLIFGVDGLFCYVNVVCDRFLWWLLLIEMGLLIVDVVYFDDFDFVLVALINLELMDIGWLVEVWLCIGDWSWCYWEVRGSVYLDMFGIEGYLIVGCDIIDCK